MENDENGLPDPAKNKERVKKYLSTFLTFLLIGTVGFLCALGFNHFFVLHRIPIRIMRVLALIFIATAVQSRMPWRDQSFTGINSWEKIDSTLFKWLYYLSIFVSSFSIVVNEADQ